MFGRKLSTLSYNRSKTREAKKNDEEMGRDVSLLIKLK